jgi:DNA-binding NtrC family response regulator
MMPKSSRILLVEDDPEQTRLFALILAKDQREVESVYDAESALARLAESPFALLLVDWDLPAMKGDTLIATVKTQYPETKTILVSNHAHVDEAAGACGADGWFYKMDSTARLRQLVADLLHEGAARR